MGPQRDAASASNLRAPVTNSTPTALPETIHALPLLRSNSALDVGFGSPAEILREGELTQSLLLLYFRNFDDIHVMLDQTYFMRQFVLGNVPKVLLFAVMSLGIR